MIAIAWQLTRYAAVGIGLNGLGYLAYLALTAMAVPPKAAVTVISPILIVIHYLMQRRYVFHNRLINRSNIKRYLVVYSIAYLENLGLLFLLSDLAGYPHQLVQLGTIALLAVQGFLLSRLWVFKPS
jgi:putative flippase GtrA